VAIEHAPVEALAKTLKTLAKPTPRVHIEAMLAIVRASRLDQGRQQDLLETELALLRTPLEAELRVDLLRLIELTYMLGPQKAGAPASTQLRPILLGLFDTGVDTPANRETARLLAFLDEPRAVGLILQHQAAVPALEPQIHDAYCLRAMKGGWTDESKQQFWSWYQKAAEREAGYSFRGYLGMMVQELIPRLDQAERVRFLAQGERFPFPTGALVRALELDAEASWVPALISLYGRLGSSEQAGQKADLRGLIIDKLGTSTGPDAQAALRSLYQLDPRRLDPIARAMARHPTEENLEILLAALDSRDTNTSNMVLGALSRLQSNPSGPEALAKLIRIARRNGPAISGTLNRLASRWTGVAAPSDARSFGEVLAAWETVYRQRFPSAPPVTQPRVIEPNSYSLDLLVDSVLHASVMKTASSARGRQVIERARCLECHKFGLKGEGLGPDLSTVSSRFRPREILESIVEPSKVISDQYKPVSVATSDGKVYNGMPVGTDGNKLVLLLSDSTKVTIPNTEIDAKKESRVSVMPAGLIDGLTYQEIADLLALFESAPSAEPPAALKK
jgi:putative heme-binding domain-containing protein